MKNTSLIAFILLILTACQKPKGFDYRGVRNLNIEQLGSSKSSLSLEMVYFNPNNFGVTLKKIDCDVSLNKNYLGRFQLDTLMHIPKKAEFSIPSKMEVDWKDIIKNAFTVVLSKEVLISVKGSTRVGKSGIFITVPFNYEEQQTIEF